MRRQRLRKLLGWTLLGGLAAAAWAGSYVLRLPDVGTLKRSPPKSTAYIELRREQARRRGKPFHLQWVWVPWEGISEHLKHAVFIAEDDMFYRHKGVDWEATKLALARDWEERRLAFGGSTITQQTARNLYLSPTKNPLRKVKEMLIAQAMERELGKRRIFELYLNIAEWGKGIFGAEAAAQAYFGHSAAELTVDEAVAMAVVLPNPKRWSPSRRGRYVERNMRRVMQRMKASGLLPEEEEAPLDPEELTFSSGTAESPRLPDPALSPAGG